MIKERIKKELLLALKELEKMGYFSQIPVFDLKIEKSPFLDRGDYSSNIAFLLVKKNKKKPQELAQILVQKINQKNKLFEKIEVAGNGFINFFLSRETLLNELKKIEEKNKDYGALKPKKKLFIQVEFISANPTGPLTVGNARGGAFGDCLANVFKKAGHKVEKEYYVNDCGKQIFALGNSVLKNKDATYRGNYIEKISQKIKEKESYLAGQAAAKMIIEEMIKKTIEKFNIKYDNWFFESNLHRKKEIDKTLAILSKKNLVYKKEGALWFKSSALGDSRDRVLIKKNGEKTYLAGDIAYHRHKFENKKYDKVINIWGADHFGDVAGLMAGIEALGHKGKLEIILMQFVSLMQSGKIIKMSKRKGSFVLLDDFLSTVGKDAARFFFLEKSADTHLNFDLDLAKERSAKNPVYYIQYAYARICGILKKCKTKSEKCKTKNQDLKFLTHPSEMNLIRQLVRFPEIVESCARDYQLQRIPKYVLELANDFHKFYQDCRVIGEDKNIERARIFLVSAVKIVLKNSLDLMGISAPEKM